MRILLVENHSVFAEHVTKNFLASHSVTVVPSLSAARLKLAAGNYEVLLIDYDLDDGKGDKLVLELRSAGSRTRIIGISAREDGNIALSKAGADAICSKMEFDQILSVI